ncbi:hypothetical protein CEXT_624201 [Caerostris extrusa]|uniref:Uncharacterized protein n=1 Tax=Caerostris extrusa TaxID=172846 RepID=A0AAV4P9Q8_CAEEX|nr:hypothetical protein CEXT_624201 [Caerostris extrusa]
METSQEYSEQIMKYKSRVNRHLSESVQVGKDEINKVPAVTSEIKTERDICKLASCLGIANNELASSRMQSLGNRNVNAELHHLMTELLDI